MRKLEDFRKLGHKVFMLIGDFTGRIGDPSDKKAARKKLTPENVNENLKLYSKQASSLLSINDKENPVEVVFNNDWLGKLSFAEVVELASHFTVQQMMKRNMFQARLEEDKPIFLNEFLYPLMQGYDSVVMDVDIELGGNDQLFNMLAGRVLQTEMNGREKFVIAGKLLTTADGKKMGKSEGNMITLADSGNEIYGKVMAFTDEQILGGFELLTNTELEEVAKIAEELKTGKNPMNLKKQLAWKLVSELKSATEADEGQKYFEDIFQNKVVNVDIPEVKIAKDNIQVLELLIEVGFAKSKSDARRLIEQGAVKIDEVKVENWDIEIGLDKAGSIIRAGKRIVKALKN
jgi:tyrosyl-tRNA synthetase